MKTFQKFEIAEISFAVRILPITQRQLPIKGMDAGARHFNCTIVRQDGGWQDSPFTVEYSQGSGIKEDPTAQDVVRSVVGDAQSGEYSFEEFCDEFGYDTDSRSAEATWKQCKATADALARMGIEDIHLYDIEEAFQAQEAL